MFNLGREALMNLLAQQFAQGYEQLPENVKQALQDTEVFILREDRQVRIVSRSLSGDEEQSRRVAEGLANALIPLLVRVIGGFKCRVKYQ